MGVLAEILQHKRAEIAELRGRSFEAAPARRPVQLRREPGEPLRLIAEIKRRSPSAGPLSTRLGVAERAAAYEAAGASVLSVLTDARYFDGAWSHLRAAREATALPVLCKDFVLDEIQLDAARAHGADAVLVIVRCLEPARVHELGRAAAARGLDVLYEVATESEAAIALDAGAALVGVNARDLDTLEMDPARAARVLAELPASVVAVHLSGLGSAADVERVAASRADAALLGEALMRLDDPRPLLEELVRAAQNSSAPAPPG